MLADNISDGVIAGRATALLKNILRKFLLYAFLVVTIQLVAPFLTGYNSDYSLVKSAHAGELPTYPIASVDEVCPDDAEIATDRGFRVFTFIVPCVRAVFENIANSVVDNFFAYISGFYYTAIVLAVVLYGVSLLMGLVAKVGRDTFIIGVKLAAVIWFSSNMTGVMQAMLAILDGFIQTITQFSAFNTSDRCPATDPIWVRMDCLVDIIIGIGAPQTLANGLLSFFVNSFISGAMGAVIGVIGILFTVNIIIGLFKAAFTYLYAVIAIMFLILISGLFVPLVLFPAAAKGFFDKWLGMMMSMLIQPVILFAYLNIALAAFDTIIYSGEDSIYNAIMGDAADRYDTINEFLAGEELYFDDGGPELYFDMNSTRIESASQRADRLAAFGNVLAPESIDYVCMRDENQNPVPPSEDTELVITLDDGTVCAADTNMSFFTNQDNLSSNDYAIRLPMRIINWSKLAVAAGYATSTTAAMEKAVLTDIVAAFLIAGLASYIFLALLKFIPTMAMDLAGGIQAAPTIGDINKFSQNPNNVSGIGGVISRTADNIKTGLGSLVRGR